MIMRRNTIERKGKKRQKAIEYINKKLTEAINNNHKEDEQELKVIINLLNSKRYGLVWEKTSEEINDNLKKEIPVLKENENREIVSNNSSNYNFLIEGDNLYSLNILKKTHLGRINIIYIDPPYNTGKDFVYNDKLIDKNDAYLHSKWLTFMENRLKLALNLLKENGIIFISIDDREFAQLKLLCDSIFGEDNYICNFIRKTKSMTGDHKNGINIQHEYLLCYAKNKDKIRLYGKKNIFKGYSNPDNDPNGIWHAGDPSAKSGGESTRFQIKNPYNGHIDEPPEGRYWAFSKKTMKEYIKSGKIKFKKEVKPGQRGFIFKRYAKDNSNKYMPVDSLEFTENNYINAAATKELKKLMDNKDVFDYPKPVDFIKKIIKLYGDSNSIVLDFFAGSGTTAQAVMELNKEDNGNRSYILCTNNENGIAENVTYKRIKKVQHVLPHNFKYMNIGLIDKDDDTLESKLLNSVRNLINLENMTDIDRNQNITLIKDIKEAIEFKPNDNTVVYMRGRVHDMLPSQCRSKYINTEIIDVPERYFLKELSDYI